MYGTVTRYRLKAGSEAAEQALEAEFKGNPPAGFVRSYTYRLDSGNNEYLTCAVFESKEAYTANSNSPAQQAWFARMAELMDGEPAWSDGEVISEL